MILIAGAELEFQSSEVVRLLENLKRDNKEYDLIKHARDWSYRDIETQIEACDSLVVILGPELNSSTWLNHCLHYAWNLSHNRMNRRPRLYSLRLPDQDLPNCDINIKDDIKEIFEVSDLYEYEKSANQAL
jgi:hypothetical protein